MKLIILASCLFMMTSAQFGRGRFGHRGRGFGYRRGYGGRGYHVGYGGYGAYGGYGGAPFVPAYGHPVGVPGPFVPPYHVPHGFYPGVPEVCKDKDGVPVVPAAPGPAGPPAAGPFDDYDYFPPGFFPRGPGRFPGRPGARPGAKPAPPTTTAGPDKDVEAVPAVTAPAETVTSDEFQLDARKKVKPEVNDVSGLTGSDTEPIKDIFLGGVDETLVGEKIIGVW